jgi:hypothetical protein
VGLYTLDLPDDMAIICENIDFTLDRATYVFKTSKANYHSQIERIRNAIAMYAQFRSTLIHKSTVDENHEIFKNSFGFVKSIRKNRGRKEAFSNWKRNLLRALNMPTPILPSNEEIENLIDWSLEIYHASPQPKRVKSKVNKILDKDIVIRILPEIAPEYPDSHVQHIQKMTRIHSGLKRLNEKIVELLNF